MSLKEIKQSQKKSSDELREYLHFKRRGFSIQPKRGKGAYSRKDKYKNFFENL